VVVRGPEGSGPNAFPYAKQDLNPEYLALLTYFLINREEDAQAAW
jgi:hypothetical protein